MSAGFTPDTVRLGLDPVETQSEFDRWLAAHDRKIKAEALREAASEWYGLAERWLRERAEAIEAGEPVSALEWADPPSKGSVDWTLVASELRARPGEWAIVDRNATVARGTAIKKGRIEAFQPAGSFEATMRGNGDGRYTVYARYVGHPRVDR